MKKLLICLAFLLPLGTLTAGEGLLPLEQFAKKAKVTQMKISPTGEYMAFTFEHGTEVRAAIMDRKTKEIISKFETGDKYHVQQLIWLNDERIGMWWAKVEGHFDGKPQYPFFSVSNVDGKNRKQLWTYEYNYNMSIASILEDDPKNILIQTRHYADNGRAKLRKLNIYSGRDSYIQDIPHSARHTTPGVVGYGVDLEDKIRFAFERDEGEDEFIPEDDTVKVHFKDDNGEWQFVKLESKRKYPPNLSYLGMSKNNRIAYFTSNHDLVESDTTGLFSFNFDTREIALLFRHPDVDIQGAVRGKDEEVIGVSYEAGYPEYFYIENNENKTELSILKTLQASFPSQDTSITSRTDNGKNLVVHTYSGRNPGEFYLYDIKKKKINFLQAVKPEVDPKTMARVEPFVMNARDGLKMYGLLTIPNNVEEKNLPMIVYPHGGPYGVRDDWRWDRRAQMFASRGYLVMQINFRGSGGYGYDFERKGYGEQGRKMQDDVTDATLWAVKSGLADKNRICIHGVSYGGQATMTAAVMEPDLYKCAIPDAGVYDVDLQLQIADYVKGRHGGEVRKNQFIKRIGSIENNEERSPVYHVDKVKADLFLVHGTEDVRVPIDHSYLLEEKLKEAGKPYIKMYKDDGHGFQKIPYRLELYDAMLKFVEKNIGPGAKPMTKVAKKD